VSSTTTISTNLLQFDRSRRHLHCHGQVEPLLWLRNSLHELNHLLDVRDLVSGQERDIELVAVIMKDDGDLDGGSDCSPQQLNA
jgi:hypothetical protein